MQEALYDLLRLHSLMEEEHAEEVASKEHEIDHLKQMVEALARRQSKSFSRVSYLLSCSTSQSCSAFKILLQISSWLLMLVSSP